MSRWILRMSSCGSNAGMETSASLISAVVNNVHSYSRINQILPQIIHILRFLSSRLAAPYFEIEVGSVQWTEIWKFLQVFFIILHYFTFGLGAANDAQNVRSDTARGKDNDQQNISKMITWYRSVYNQTASDAWRYNNPIYKLMTDKLQLMLINVLLNIKVSQGSVATHIRCDGIFNDLLSPRVKKISKSVNICQSYGQLTTGLFFMKHGVVVYIPTPF